MDNNNIISYATFLKERDKFRSSGTRTGSEFNIYDTPSHKFFKILFYFWNGDLDRAVNHSGGLLAPTWEIYDTYKNNIAGGEDSYYMFDSAWSYLMNNGEYERAEKLEQFVTLLSNINCESPWYFNEVSGLGEALMRKATTMSELKLEEERKKISIKCLPDAYDNRIETLLSLYRDIVWSWSNKREVVPANLRKFDMGIYIWESPIYALNTNTVLDEQSSEYSSSYKLIEFHNCEFDYDSLKSGYETLTNKEGITQEFTIDILFDDCYEHTYNSLMMRTIGDVITTDTAIVSYDEEGNSYLYDEPYAQGTEQSKYNNSSKINTNNRDLDNILNESSKRKEYWDTYRDEYNKAVDDLHSGLDNLYFTGRVYRQDHSNFDNWDHEHNKNLTTGEVLPDHKGAYKSKGFVGNLLSEVGGAIFRDVKSSATRLLLGNLYTYSISKMADQLKGVLNGQVFTALNAVDEYAGTDIMGNMHNYSLSNLAGRGQKLLNDHVNDRKNGRTGNQNDILGALDTGFKDTTPAAQTSYQSTTLDRSEPENTMGDIFPTIPSSKRVQSLGNLNQARTLINNI